MRILGTLLLLFTLGCGDTVENETLEPPPPSGEADYTYPGDVFDSGGDPFGECGYGYSNCDNYGGGIDCDNDPCIFGTCTVGSYEGDFCACPPGYTGPYCQSCADGFVESQCTDCENGYECSQEDS